MDHLGGSRGAMAAGTAGAIGRVGSHNEVEVSRLSES